MDKAAPGSYPQPWEWRPSRSVDLYEQQDQIEEGTYGVVFRARDTETGDIVAIKKLKLEGEREGFPVTSLREISALLALKHPNIVNLKEVVVGHKAASVFLVMDWAEHDLRTLLDRAQSAPPLFRASEIKSIVHQILRGISFMHEHWVIHRDLKPSNLLYDSASGLVKIADFGLARRVGDPCPTGQLTELVVTLWYRAPEVLLGSREYGPPVDLWSIGCILAELCMGRPLFPGTGEIDQMDRIISILGMPTTRIWPDLIRLPHAGKLPVRGKNEYNLLDRTCPQLSPSGLDLLDRLLTFDPSRRISADEALKHPWFAEVPLPADPKEMPGFPNRLSVASKANDPSKPSRPSEPSKPSKPSKSSS